MLKGAPGCVCIWSSSTCGFAYCVPSTVTKSSFSGSGCGGTMKRFSYCANCGGASASAASCGRIASAAWMPSCTNFGAAAKSMNDRLPRSGEIRMSPGRSCASCVRTFCSVRMLIICDA